jgi:hypothetical protein
MKRKYYLLVLIFLISLGSCKKFLDPKPTDFLNPADYYETEQQLQYARSSVYHYLGSGGLYGSYTQYLLAWCGDEGYMNRATLTTGPWNYFYSSSDSYNGTVWSTLWAAINRANVVLANIDNNLAISQAKRDLLRGEMLFLRGYYYFILAQYYGGVPLKLTPTTSVVDVDIARNTLAETYAQILKDMEAAEPLVPGIATLKYGGAISKSAVRGYLARVNLQMAGEPLKDVTRYAEASKWAKMVMDDTEAAHALNPSYPVVFQNLAGDKYDIKESIWEAEFWGNRTDAYVETTNQGWINGPASGSGNTNTGRADAYMYITSKLYNIYEDGDNRKWWNIAFFTYASSGANGSKTVSALPATEGAKNTKYPAKWRREYETLLPKNATTTPENVPLLRFADILMMYAEAENAINGPTAAAIDAVNRVRQRGWSTGVNTITVTNGGAGYTTAPTVNFVGGGGTGGAAATATVAAGKVTAVTLNRDATGVKFNQDGDYASVPNITFTGGGGTGATATATIYRKTDANLTAAQTASKESFLALIQDERMREFNFELSRKSDLLRWGIFLKVNQDMGNLLQSQSPGLFFVKYFTNVSARDLWSPIPVSETSTNLKMEQNPGWN